MVALGVDVGVQVGERFVAAEERAPAEPGREMRCDAEEQLCRRCRDEAGAEEAQLGFLELVAAEGERCDQE